MPIDVIMPVLGPSMEQGTIQQWLKGEGDPVVKNEPLLVVETDKATVDVPAPASGVLHRILAPAGSVVPVTHSIALIASADDAGRGDWETGRRGEKARATAQPGQLVEPPREIVEPAATARVAHVDRIRATPVARKLGRELGIDLSTVVGTGPEGRIHERDVRTAATTRSAAPSTPAHAELILSLSKAEGPLAQVPSPDLPPSPHPPVSPSELHVPLTRVRAITAERMAQSARSAPHVTLIAETDFSEAVRFRRQLAPEFERRWGARLSYDTMIAKACAIALAEHPDFNSQWADGALRRNAEIHIGLAVQTDRGLLAPVLRNADQRPLHELSRQAAELVESALAGKLLPNEMAGGTFTITNLGSFGVDAFTPIINPPQAAILGVGRIAPRAAVMDGVLVARETAWLSLSFDHRVADGASAAQFLARIRAVLESPYLLLA